MKSKILLFPLSIILASSAIAGQFVWTGGTNSNWTTASNWTNVSLVSPDAFPTLGGTYAGDFLTIRNNGDLTNDPAGTTPGAGAVYNPGPGVTTSFNTGRGLAIGIGNGPLATPPNLKGRADLTVTSGTLAFVRVNNFGSEPFMANRADVNLLINGGHLDLSQHVNNFRLIQEGFPGITSTITLSSGALSCRVLDLLFDEEKDPSTVFGDGIINLDGGVFTLSRIIRSAAANPEQTTSTINLNGGTLKTFAAIGSPNVFIGPLPDTQFIVKTGGAIIDTNNLTNTISANLLHDPALEVSLDGGLTKNNSGALTLSGINTYNGGTTIQGGTLIISSDENLGAPGGGLTFGATVNLNVSASIANSNRVITLNSGIIGNIQLAPGVEYINDGKVTGDGSLRLRPTGTGSGRVATFASQQNDFTGTLYIDQNGGTQQISVALNSLADPLGAGNIICGALGADTFPSVRLGADAEDGLTLDNRRIELAGVMGNGSSFSINNQNETHPITVNSDLLVSGAIGVRRLTLAGVAGPINVFAGDIADGVDSVVSVAKSNNASVWTLSGDNSHSGGTTLNGGTSGSQLNINSPTALGTGTFNIGGGDSGRIDNTSGNPLILITNNPQNWNNNFVFVGTNSLDLGTGDVTLGANRTIFVQGSTLTVGGVISGIDRGITKGSPGGTLLLTNANTYTGATSVAAGTLALGATGSIADSASVSITAGATLNTSAKTSHAIPASQPLTLGINAGGSGTSGRIVAAGLDISAANVTYNISGTPDDPVYVLATYTSLSGTPSFASVDPAPAGYTLEYAYEGNKIALVQDVVTGGFASWQTANGTAGGLDQDHDNDGVSNGVEYFLFGSASSTGFTALPGVTDTAGALSVTWTKAATGYSGTYGSGFVVETSESLATGSWTTETLGGPVTVTGNDVKYTFPSPPGSKKFARLKVTGP